MQYFRVGMLYFQEPFSKELDYRISQLGPIRRQNGEEVQILVEHIPIQEYGLDLPFQYDLVVDRASHYFKLGISMLMMLAHRGVRVVNNPFSFHYFINRKDVGYHIAHQLGCSVPPTYVLPPCKTPFFKEDDFVHHQFFDWEGIIEEVGFPCFIKPANGRGARGVTKCNNRMELMEAYDKSGKEIMVLQSMVPSEVEWQVRCLCVGKSIEIAKYIFRDNDQSEYLEDENFLPPEIEKNVIEQSQVICRSMGYEMNSVEFFIDSQGIPWAIDFNNPIPDGRLEALGQMWYERYQNQMIQMVIDAAEEPKAPDFIPDVNVYAEISRENLPREERFKKASLLASKYYKNSY